MTRKATILKPGIATPQSGQYAVVGPRGGKLGIEVTSIQGKPLPPTAKSGQGYVLVDLTRHKK